MDASPEVQRTGRARAIGLALLLAAGTLLLYLPVRSHAFVTFDDTDYVVENPGVNGGLSAEGLRWAFTSFHSSNWHPLTWLSHQLDVELFGLDAGGHHVTSALLHALNAALCFATLLAATRAPWPSVVVAALFAVHPLRVESVAWVSERKDLLAGTFFWLCILAHVRRARRPSPMRHAAVAGLFALGLLAKPMLVTLPFVLLLLDVWPLGRTRTTRFSRLVVEKLPLLALAAASCAVTLVAQSAGRAVQSLAALPFDARLSNALVAYGAYLVHTVWPAGLAFFHPHPALVDPDWTPWNVRALASLVLLGVVSALAWRARSRAPYLLVGWLWFAGMLFPVVGLVQVGEQAWAERYAYLPLVGVYVGLAFGAAEIVRARPGLRSPATAAALAAIAACAVVSWRQIDAWRDSERLYTRALEVTERNYRAHLGLGNLRQRAGDAESALEEYERALAIRPDYAPSLFNLGLLRQTRSELRAAAECFRAAIEADPLYRPPYLNLSRVLVELDEPERAEALLRDLIARVPDDPSARWNLGLLHVARGDDAGAREHLERAARAAPRQAEIHHALGSLHARAGRRAAAIDELRTACELAPERPAAAAELAWILATAPEDELLDADEALRWARRAVETRAASRLEALEALAAALANAGRFPEACEEQARALELAPPERRGTIRQRLRLYQEEEPFRESP